MRLPAEQFSARQELAGTSETPAGPDPSFKGGVVTGPAGNPPVEICYLRKGRKLRATGEVTNWQNGLVKVKPRRDNWGHVWLTPEEIDGGKEKPAYQTKPKHAEAPDDLKPKRARKPKPAPVPRWKQLVEDVRVMEIDHVPDGWPAVKMRFISELAAELENAQTLFQNGPDRFDA